jgi:FlaA1/EpsC-like NDP-sugar epimerase
MNTKEACQLILEGCHGRWRYSYSIWVSLLKLLARNMMIRLAGFIPDKEIEIQVVGLRGRN